MSNKTPLKDSICNLILDIAPEIDISELDPNEDMRDELDLDSMDFIRLLEAIEKNMGVSIPETDYKQVHTLNTMAEYISAKHE
jgi:acyl carrier protein